MSLAQALTTYLTLNLLVGVAFISHRALFGASGRGRRLPSASLALRLNYALLAAVLLITLVHPFIPKSPVFQPTAKVWSAQSLKTFSRDFKVSDGGGYLSIPMRDGSATLPAAQVSLVLAVLSLAVCCFSVTRVAKDLLALRRIRKESYLIRRIGAVSLLAHDRIRVPFSYWTPWRAVVAVPTPLMPKGQDYRIAVAHELQHHRQADTKWVYGIWALRALCALNPFAHLWARWIAELQEFACDEALVDRRKVESRRYARCLIEVAENALEQEYTPECATGLVFLVERTLLGRRIERMMSPSKPQARRSIQGLAGGLVLALMAATAFASQSMVQDRRVSLPEARKMAARAESGSPFPIVVNDLVLHELNRYIGTPEGRDFMRQSLSRMEGYRSAIEPKIREHQLPLELMAVPLVESGYQGLKQDHAPYSAGIWQFIPSTARAYGLRVDGQVDERMDPGLLTDAALRYLKANHARFNDWLLSVLAYNAGEKQVEEAIAKTGSRDAWTLIRAGYENDPSYLARVMAAVIVLRNPGAVAR